MVIRPTLLLVGTIALVGSSCVSAWEPSKRDQADGLIHDASQKFAQSDFAGNVRLLKQASEVDPSYPKVWWKLCEAYQLTDELDLAVAACQRNIDLDPSDLSYNSLGLAHNAQKDYVRAAQAFEKAAADSEVPQIHFNLVWALLDTKQYEKAVPAAQRLVDVSAEEPSDLKFGFEALGVAYQKLGQATRAQDAFQKAHVQSCEMTISSKGDPSLACKN